MTASHRITGSMRARPRAFSITVVPNSAQHSKEQMFYVNEELMEGYAPTLP